MVSRFMGIPYVTEHPSLVAFLFRMLPRSIPYREVGDTRLAKKMGKTVGTLPRRRPATVWNTPWEQDTRKLYEGLPKAQAMDGGDRLKRLVGVDPSPGCDPGVP